jgi:hypothetical protein
MKYLKYIKVHTICKIFQEKFRWFFQPPHMEMKKITCSLVSTYLCRLGQRWPDFNLVHFWAGKLGSGHL